MLVLGAALCGACQHQILVRSWPSGAEVTLDESPDLDEENVRRGTPEGTRAAPSKEDAALSDRENLGATPLSWSEDIGPKKPRVLHLTLGDEVREVVVERADYNWPAVLAWSAGGAGACVGLTAVGFAAWGIGLGASSGQFAPFFPGVTLPIGLLACAGGVGAGVLYGRQGPTEVMVDFEGANVVSLPPDLARWKGEPPPPLDLETFQIDAPEVESAPTDVPRPELDEGESRPSARRTERPANDADDKLVDGPPLQF